MKSLNHLQLIPKLKNIIPKFTGSHHKGQHGKIAIIGGCFEYTGAPYISAICSVKTGAELGYVFCSKDAATPIKAYGPELIVIGALRTAQEIKEEKIHYNKDEIVNPVKDWLSRVHAIVVGPGLGRDVMMQQCAKELILHAKQLNLPVVVDGDGIWAVENDPSLIAGYPKALITANFNEYSRLCKKILAKDPPPLSDASDTHELQSSTAMELAKRLGNVTLICKGSIDIITDGNKVIFCTISGGLRRCGGIGDVLAGIVGTFAAWANYSLEEDEEVPRMMLAAYGGCALTRDCTFRCFVEKGRSMVAHDIVSYIGPIFKKNFEHHAEL